MSGFIFIDTISEFESDILNSHKGSIVLFIENKHKMFEQYMKLSSELAAKIGGYVNVVVF